LAAESIIAMAFDHAVWRHYLAAMRTERIADEFVPTLGEKRQLACRRSD
jgi:hypothetical protein